MDKSLNEFKNLFLSSTFLPPFSCRCSGMTSYSVPKDKIKEKMERHAVVE